MDVQNNVRSDKIISLRKKAVALPLKPGVYIMLNTNDDIIYIGKAKNLKNRVSQYFGSNTNHSDKVRQMVANVNDFKYIICDSEFEALILECSLIKQHTPKYNILLKDDKGYHYIKITNGQFRTIKTALQIEDDGAVYLGPYSSGFVVKNTVEEAQKIFKLPHCNKEFLGKKLQNRPCLNYHIGACCAPCSNKINLNEYETVVDEAINFIKGGSKLSVRQLEKEMQLASDKLDFEKAAKLRDRIKAIKSINDKQKVMSCIYDCQDVFAFIASGKKVAVEVFVFKNSRLCDRKQYYLDLNDKLFCFRSSFIKQYYISNDIPKRIVVDEEFEDSNLIAQMFSERTNKKVEIIIPQIGEQKHLVEMCKTNALEFLLVNEGKQNRAFAALTELQSLLNLKNLPRYIESYDISHTMGHENVAGMIVFEDGKPLKKAYKKFKIKSFVGQDDCRSMSEVIERRFIKYLDDENKDQGFSRLPDLILLDGGTAQLNAVEEVLNRLGLNVSVFGMVKDNKHKTNAIASNGGEIAIKSNRAAYTLISNIQEEVHRFAIGYHRKSSAKVMLHSELTEIPGVGKTTADKLLKHFKTINAIKSANISDLCNVKGLSKATANNIFAYYNARE